MISGWKDIRFSEVLVGESISYGIVQPGSHKEEDSVPIIRVKNIINGSIDTSEVLRVDAIIEGKYLRTRLKGGELLITVVGRVGDCVIVPESFKGWNVARAVSVANIKDSFNKQFIRYAFQTEDVKYQLYGNTNDTVQPTLNLSSLKGIILRIPPLPEQKAIAKVLSSLDDKIDLLHRQNKTLEAMAETLYRHWFVEGVKEDWEDVKLDKLINISSGKGLKKSEFNESGRYRVLGANGEIGKTDNYLYDDRFIFTGRVGTLGNVFRIENEKVWLSDNTLIIKPSKGYNFMYFTLKYCRLDDYNVGSTQPLIRQSDVKNIVIKLPEDSLLIRFEELGDLHFRKIKKNNMQIKILSSLRDTLLPSLMNGEVIVRMNE